MKRLKRTKPTENIDTVVDTVRVKSGMRLTSDEAPNLSEELKKEIDDGVARIIFDMAETVTIDSKGITFFKTLAVKPGVVFLKNVSPGILDMLTHMQVDRLHVTGCRKG